MIKKILICLLLFSFFSKVTAQEKRKIIKGVIKNSKSNPIANAHIVNLTTNIGTVSNDLGQFRIPLKKGDWLQISNIQYQTKKMRLKKGLLAENNLLIYLLDVKNELEEVVIKKKMKKYLELDRTGIDKDTTPKLDTDYFDFSKIIEQFRKIKKKPVDKSEAQYHTDPTMKNVSTTIARYSIPDNRIKKKKAIRKKLQARHDFPSLLLKEFGEEFFFKELKIPKDKYYHFLEYCIPLGVEQLFTEKKQIEVLKILLKESKSYKLLLEKNK